MLGNTCSRVSCRASESFFGSTVSLRFHYGRNCCCRYAFASSRQLIPAMRKPFNSRSCAVENPRSTRPLACGLCDPRPESTRSATPARRVRSASAVNRSGLSAPRAHHGSPAERSGTARLCPCRKPVATVAFQVSPQHTPVLGCRVAGDKPCL